MSIFDCQCSICHHDSLLLVTAEVIQKTALFRVKTWPTFIERIKFQTENLTIDAKSLGDVRLTTQFNVPKLVYQTCVLFYLFAMGPLRFYLLQLYIFQ